MRICVLANALAVHTQRWARAYAERGHEVHVLSIRRVEIPGVRVHTVCVGPRNSGSRAWTFLSYLRLLLSARRRLSLLAPKVLHAHFTLTHGVIAAFSGFHPTLLSAWGSDVIRARAGRLPWWFRLLNRFALTRADLVSSSSNFMAARIRALAPVGKEVQHVPFGIDCEAFQPEGTRPEPDDGGKLRIGFVKSLKPIYGPDILVRAMAKVIEAAPRSRLVMAGGGPMRRELERLVEELGFGIHVEFAGFVPHERVPDLMRRFDIFVNCSVVPESFGVAVLEASACGLPIVATRVGGVPEVCRDGVTGLMVEPRDSDALAGAIIRLAKDKALRKRMGTAGRRFVLDTYAWRDNVDLMLKHLEGLAGTASRDIAASANAMVSRSSSGDTAEGISMTKEGEGCGRSI